MDSDSKVHHLFGDLDCHDAVCMPSSLLNRNFNENRPYYVHLSITGRCNARCAGCVNSDVTFRNSDKGWLSKGSDTDPERDARAIIRLTRDLDEPEIVVSFYGGEPLLLPDRIMRVISILSASDISSHFKYMVYTNGQLLKDVVEDYPDLISEIWLWSISIDGTREQHNRIRIGTDLKRIQDNLELLNSRRTGHVLMWSTLREDQSLADCYREFLDLHKSGVVDLFFWHWVETDQPYSDLSGYMTCYEQDLRQILDDYVKSLARGEVMPVIHINELVLYFLTGKQRGTSACAVEMARNFDIMGGKVHPCADLPPEYAIGTIAENGEPSIEIADLSALIKYKDDLGCYQCGIHAYCGGRCPVQAITGSKMRMQQYCRLMRLHVGIVRDYLPDIIKYVERNDIDLQDIYDRSAHYAQFTDVTP